MNKTASVNPHHLLGRNLIAFVSLAVAALSLGYTAWRQERSERHRNLRAASFEVLKSLGELQTLVLYAHYDKEGGFGNPITGWGRVLMIKDLCLILPPKVREGSENLLEIWQANWKTMAGNEESVQKVLTAIQDERSEVLKVLEVLR